MATENYLIDRPLAIRKGDKSMRARKIMSLLILISLLVFIFIFLVLPSYTPPRTARKEVVTWFNSIAFLQAEISDYALKNKTLYGAGKGLISFHDLDNNVTFFKVTDSGTIIVQGGSKQQLVVLIPEMHGTELRWTCLVSPTDAAPIFCRKETM